MMIELQNDQLIFSFPQTHKKATCSISFQRTLRIPDDNQIYPLPPGLGNFPIKHVDDYDDTLPTEWSRHGGVFISMYQSEALWVNFSGRYPCAIKIAAGKINAVTGESWCNELSDSPQDYVVTPDQPWLDGFNVAGDFIRQFIAMPLGQGYSAEEQLTNKAEHGGLQIIVYPMKHKVYQKHLEQDFVLYEEMPLFSRLSKPDMGLAPGGLMKQKIVEDQYGLNAWDQENGLRLFIHLANSEMYQKITSQQPPHAPPTAKNYTEANLPWFSHYSDNTALPGSTKLGQLISFAAQTLAINGKPLAHNKPLSPKVIIKTRNKNIVKDGEF